jgi:hypothetical protein
MKSISEWLDQLPEPYRTKALDNMEWDDYSADDMVDALQGAFLWENTPEGHKYWLDLCEAIDDGVII